MCSEVKIDLLQQNLKQLCLKGLHSDIIFRVENREFPVHKGILSVRSPVFASMFKYDMLENRSDVVDIPDCSADAFELFLLYLYTGIIENITAENVFKLYYISDKYYVDELKEPCLEFIKNNVTLDNFCDVLELAMMHSELELQSLVIKFFFDNSKTLNKIERWQKFRFQNPLLVNELIIKALQSLKG